MHALYLLGASYFDATVIIPTYMGYWRTTDFMTCDPVHLRFVIMSIQLKTMDATQNSDEFSVLCYVLRAIVSEIEAISHPTIDLKTRL